MLVCFDSLVICYQQHAFVHKYFIKLKKFDFQLNMPILIFSIMLASLKEIRAFFSVVRKDNLNSSAGEVITKSEIMRSSLI